MKTLICPLFVELPIRMLLCLPSNPFQHICKRVIYISFEIPKFFCSILLKSCITLSELTLVIMEVVLLMQIEIIPTLGVVGHVKVIKHQLPLIPISLETQE